MRFDIKEIIELKKEKTLKEIGDMYGVTPQYVSQEIKKEKQRQERVVALYTEIQSGNISLLEVLDKLVR